MPLDNERLVVEPTYPNAKALMAMGGEHPGRPKSEDKEDPDLVGARIRNRWWSVERRSHIIIIEKADGSIDWGIEPGMHHFSFDLTTLGCMDAWGVEQESAAVRTFAELVSHRQFKQYMLTGMFLETSKRSGVCYMFRRLKPTVAMTTKKGWSMHILCCLCMHPIAYYQGSWAGAMCPTDDVIAHLMMMRADEAMLWKRSSQHPAWTPQAGL